MQKSLSKVLFGAALLAIAGNALAADQLKPGKIMIIKPGSLAKVLSKDTFVLPSGANDPTTAGASLLIKDTALNQNTYALPAAGWKGLGNPAGAKGFKYKGAGSPTDPCKVVLVKANIVKAVCKGAGVTLTTPVTASPAVVGVNLTTGTDHICAEFGGTEVKNTATLTKRKTSAAPAACSSPSGAFLETASLF